MVRRKPGPQVQAKLDHLSRVHAERIAHNLVIREEYRALEEKAKLEDKMRESRAANEALAAGALKSEVREIVAVKNWNTFTDLLNLTAGAVASEHVNTGGWSFQRSEGAMGRYYRIMELANPAFEPIWVLSEPVNNPMPGQFERKLSAGKTDSSNRTAAEYIENNYNELYVAIESYEQEWQTRGNETNDEEEAFEI